MNKRLSLAKKLSRLQIRLHDPEWRRYGTLLLAGKMIGAQHTPLDIAAGAAVAIAELSIIQYALRTRLSGWLDKLTGLTLRYSALSSAIIFAVVFEVSSTLVHVRAFLGLLAAMRRHVLLGMG